MYNQDDKIWEALKQYKVPDPKPGYMGRFWSRLSQKESFQEKISKFFIPKPWAFASVALSVLLVFGIFTSKNYQSQRAAMDTEIANNLELAKHWQGIEHVDMLADLDIIETADFQENS